MNCRTVEKNNVCDATVTQEATSKCGGAEICLGFGRSLKYDGDCWSVTGDPVVADGVYTEITVQGGCIIGAAQTAVPAYTPGPCTPRPAPCTGEGTSAESLAPDPCNLLRRNASGELIATGSFDPGEGIDITGCGVPDNPWIISVTEQEPVRTYIVSGTPDAITVTGAGTQAAPFIISHGLGANGTYQGFTFDQYGHLTGYVEPPDTGISEIVQGPGIVVNSTPPVATISLQQIHDSGEAYQFGGNVATVDLYGRVSAVNRDIEITAGQYDPFDYLFTLNEYGSVTEMTQVIRQPFDKFSRIFSGSRTISGMTVVTAVQGNLRISYLGDLGEDTAPAVGVGLAPLPAGVQVFIDDVQVSGYTSGWRDGRLTRVDVISGTSYPAGTHRVELRTTEAVADTGVMDIAVVGGGS